MRVGERYLVVPASSEAAFRRALRDLGFLLASGETRAPKGRARDRDALAAGASAVVAPDPSYGWA